MATNRDSTAERYSAQIRASQFDPDFDADSYNYQQHRQQSQQLSPRASQELRRPVGNFQDHYPTSSFSANSAATTIINLTSQNSSSHGLDQIVADPPSSLPADHRPASGLSAPPITNNSNQSQPTPTSPPSKKLSSFFPSSILRKPSQSQPLTSQEQSSSPPQQPDRTSRSSLQHSPFSASLAGGGGDRPLNEIYAQPNPVFLYTEKDQQLSHRHPVSAQDTAGNSVLTLAAQNRQDEGRLQLDKDRAYMKKHKLRTWTKSKFLLLLANTLLLAYSVASTVVMVMSWKGVPWTKPYLDSGIMYIANHKLLYLMMVTAPFGIFVAVVGYLGILCQSRRVLTIYAILLWPLFALITSIGYICYRRLHVQLYQKLKFSWINEYSRDDRLVIQNALSCCGYRSLGDYPSYDLHCFPRAPLPSCESLFLQYQQDLLTNTSSAAFIMVPVQLLIMMVALLCSNHIDHLYRTAHPITPKLYTQ
ncbi:hypothetical protein EMPS_05309 [Entomortierella parvispora]|uniref:Tetraspanin Tsp2 n=1 Tax=Entomortierella parvispora TaxID=205924 RepID=A0A9P3HA28_9FUNG|nr:hypothetical protein EMPS_05309 [Entomortierella parvispora]